MRSGAGATCEAGKGLAQRAEKHGGRPVFSFIVLELGVRFSARGTIGVE